MQKNACKQRHPGPNWGIRAKTINIMKLLICFIFMGIVQSQANSYAQKKVTLNVNSASIKKIFYEIKRQTGYDFLYNIKTLENAKNISVKVKNEDLEKVLQLCFKDQPFTYEILEKTIVLKDRPVLKEAYLTELKEVAPILIKGKVVDSETGKTLEGVSIREKGTNNGTVTDAQGNFSLRMIDSKNKLQISYVGYVDQELQANDKNELYVILKPKDHTQEEIVIVGYGTQKKTNVTSAISTVNLKEMGDIATSNLSNILAGRSSGVFVQTGTGVPGKTSNVRIRATSSWNGGTPLYVIDGIVRDQATFDALDPTQVQDMSVLKDAASAAIYGSRSANGVILVTTKTGKKGKLAVQYSSVFGLDNKPVNMPKYLSIDESINIYNSLNPVQINQFDKDWLHQNNPDGNIYLNETYQKPFNQQHTLNVAGGNDNVTYFIAGSFYNENGFLPQLTYQRYNVRSNLQINLTKNLRLGLNLNLSNDNRNRFILGMPGQSDDDLSGFYEKLKYIGSGFAPAYIDGKAVNQGWLGGNVVATMKDGGSQSFTNQKSDAIINLEYKIPFIKGLSVKGVASLSNYNAFTKAYSIQPMLYTFQTDSKSGIGLVKTNTVLSSAPSQTPAKPFLGNENGKTNSYQLNGIITYDRRFAEHHINLMGVYEQAAGYFNYSSIYKYYFPVYQTDQFPFTSQDPVNTNANGFETYLDSRVSYVGRLNYEFKNKYLFSASIREDGSSKFAPANRWGLFPAVSMGWIISREKMITQSKLSGSIDLLKLRLSYGSTGNDAIPSWLWEEQYNASSTGYYLGNPGALQSMLGYNGLASTNYTWETSKSYNAGIDFNFLNHWNFNVDIWTKNTSDILGKRILQLPVSFGASYPIENYGKVNAKGIDLALGFSNGKIGKDLYFNINGNLGLATTNVVREDAVQSGVDADYPVGKSLSYQNGYNAIGILKAKSQLDALPAGYTIFGVKPELGMMNFADLNGPNGKPDGIIDQFDRIVTAKYASSLAAPLSYGLSINLKYKGISLNALFAGLAGYKLLFAAPGFGRELSPINFGVNYSTYFANAWSAANTEGTAPKLYLSSDPRSLSYANPSTYNTYNASFCRLKNLNISYNLPESILDKMGISSIQLFVGATNLFTISKFKFYDPEINSSASYPIIRTITGGLNLHF